jgi:hypothetical protein
MNHKGFIIMNLLLIALIFLAETIQAQGPDNPPIDSICMVFAGIDYGGDFSSPQNFPNAKHIANIKVGSYFFQVITWHTSISWGGNSIFSWWQDMFSIWAYPESLSFTQGEVSRNCCVCADTKGDLHFAWYQSGTPDDYDIFYTRAFLDTTNGWIDFTIEKPPVMISATNGEQECHASMMTYGDSLIMIVYTVGPWRYEHAIGYNYSIDGGDTWLGPFVAYEHGGPMSWDWFCLPAIAVNPHDGDMWFAIQCDYDFNGCNDVVAFQWQHAPGDTWRHELVAAGQPAPNDHALTCPSMVIDHNEIPHIVFLECLITCGRTVPDIYSGPLGTLYYTYK